MENNSNKTSRRGFIKSAATAAAAWAEMALQLQVTNYK
jgi:hypothetical protein